MTENLDDLAPDIVSFLPSNIAEEIGKSTVAFSLLEDSLNRLISELLDSGRAAGQAVTFRIRNIIDRIELARQLAEDKAPNKATRDHISGVLDRVEAINKRRNTLIHHAITQIAWGIDDDDHTIRYRKKDFLIRDKPIETTLKGSDFKMLTTDLRLLFRALDGATNSHKLERARSATQQSALPAPDQQPPDRNGPGE